MQRGVGKPRTGCRQHFCCHHCSHCTAVTLPSPQQPPQLLTLPQKVDLPRLDCSSPLTHTSSDQGQQGQLRLVFLPHLLQGSHRLHIPGKRVGQQWSPPPLPPDPLTPLLIPPCHSTITGQSNVFSSSQKLNFPP